MKILTSATFERYDIEHEEECMFILFGPITKPAWTETYYLFKDSAKRNPEVMLRMDVVEAEKFQKMQEKNPVCIYEAGPTRIYGFKNVFVCCNDNEETIDMVRGVVWEKEERMAKRLERLRKKGAQGPSQ